MDDEYAAAHEGQVLEDEIPSAEGKILRGNTAVEIADIDSKDGKSLKVMLTDGSTADVAELSFPDAGEQELWRVIGEYAESAEAARMLLKEFRAGNLDAYKFARGAEEGFLYGMANISPGEMATRGSYVNLLDPMQRNMAYRQGQIAGERKARQRQEKIQAGKQKSSNKKGQLHFEGDRNSLTKRQKVSLQACEVIAKALGIQVYVFESERVNGKRVGDNGWYDPKDGSIHIDLHAGENAEGVMVFTLAHELGHFIKDWSPVKFRTLSKFLAEQYAKKGESVDLLVRRQQQKAEADGRKLGYEEAHEEWVCDSLETMLTDGTVLEKLSMLQAKDAGLVEKIKSFLDQFVKKLKAAYEGIRPQTVEGQIVSEMVDAAQELQELFADALIDAGENFKTAEKNTTGEGGVRYSAKDANVRYDKPITQKDVLTLREIGKKSINAFTSEDIEKAQKWAYKFYKEMGTKSPFFRAWFGDWRAYDNSPVGIVKIPKTAGKTQRSLVGIVCKDTANMDGENGWKIRISGHGERNTRAHSGKGKLSVAGLNNVIGLIENAVFLDTEVHEHHANNATEDYIAFDHKLYSLGKDELGNIALYKITVEEIYQSKSKPDDRRFHNLRYITEIEKVVENINGSSETHKENQPYTAKDVSTTKYSIRDLYGFVKEYDPEFQPKPVNPIFLNVDGTPKVVYHGSADMFDTFSYGHIGSASGVSFLGNGFYFTDKKKLAKNYGENVYECYLQMKKPYYAKEADAYRLNAKTLEKQGYDGVILNAPTGTIYMVFNNTQIKSATDNIGTFDGENSNIRYSSRSGSVSDRAMLVDLFEQMVTDSNEYKALQNYKKNMDRMMALEEKIERLGEEIRRVSFAEGPRDMEYLNNLKWQRKQAVAELDKYDNILLGLEKSGVLRAMIERNRKVITQKSRDEAWEYYRQKNETREAEIRQYYRESRRQAVERHDKAQVRQQIRKDVQRLDSLLNKGTKEKNVKLVTFLSKE